MAVSIMLFCDSTLTYGLASCGHPELCPPKLQLCQQGSSVATSWVMQCHNVNKGGTHFDDSSKSTWLSWHAAYGMPTHERNSLHGWKIH